MIDLLLKKEPKCHCMTFCLLWHLRQVDTFEVCPDTKSKVECGKLIYLFVDFSRHACVEVGSY